jgi:hypothetical protein
MHGPSNGIRPRCLVPLCEDSLGRTIRGNSASRFRSQYQRRSMAGRRSCVGSGASFRLSGVRPKGRRHPAGLPGPRQRELPTLPHLLRSEPRLRSRQSFATLSALFGHGIDLLIRAEQTSNRQSDRSAFDPTADMRCCVSVRSTLQVAGAKRSDFSTILNLASSIEFFSRIGHNRSFTAG